MSDAAKENKQADNAAKPKARALADVDANVSAQQEKKRRRSEVIVQSKKVAAAGSPGRSAAAKTESPLGVQRSKSRAASPELSDDGNASTDTVETTVQEVAASDNEGSSDDGIVVTKVVKAKPKAKPTLVIEHSIIAC